MCNSTIIFHDRLLDYSIFSGAKMTSGIILRIPIISQPTQMATLSCVAHIKSAHFCLPCTARIDLVILSLSNRNPIFVLGFLIVAGRITFQKWKSHFLQYSRFETLYATHEFAIWIFTFGQERMKSIETS